VSYQDIKGYFNFEDIYSDAVREAPKGATLVEVGVFFGRSLAFLAREALCRGRDDLQIVGVDPWEFGSPHPEADVEAILQASGGNSYYAFCQQMCTHAPEEYERVSIYKAKSSQVCAAIKPWLVFIDADHSYEGVRDDIATWRPLIQPGGIIAGHDYDPQFPGVAKAVDEAFGPGHFAPPSSWRVRL
jgi:cephalosporin hydroxylase